MDKLTTVLCRIHRIGQTRDVTVIRYVVESSLEERIYDLQQAKCAIGAGAMKKLTPEEARKTRMNDLRTLFQ
jgi:SWI/SNF-related matrix-associated actin-dependent regulator of chromatin subfamily A3